MALKVRTIRVPLRTTTGLQAITVTGFGTPTAADVTLVQATADNTETAHAQVCRGFTDGTREYCVSGSVKDGQTTEDAHNESDGAALAILCTPGTATNIVTVTFDSWITDGIQISVDVTDGNAYFLVVTLFTGCTAEVTSITITGIGTEATATLGHSEQVKAVIAASAGSPLLTGNAPTMRFTTGFAVKDGSITQRSISRTSGNGTTTTRTAARYDTSRVGCPNMSSTNGSETFGGEVTTMGTGTVGITGRGASASDRVFILLCLSGFTESVFVGDVNTPASTGDQSVTGVGFLPQAVVGATSILSTEEIANGTGNGGGFGTFAWDRHYKSHTSITSQDNVSTSREKCWSVHQGLKIHGEDGTLIAEARLASLDADGFTLNWSTVDAGTQRRCIFIAFEERDGVLSVDSGTVAEGSGGVAWTNPSDSRVSNNTRASITLNAIAGNDSNPLNFTNFDFSDLPADATIDAVYAIVQARETSGDGPGRLTTVQAWDGASVQGTNQGSTASLTATNDAPHQYGAGDWGWWTAARLKNTSNGVRLIATNGGLGSTIEIDNVVMVVEYHVADAPTIIDITPASGTQGTSLGVTIFGSGFTTATQVTFSGTGLSVTNKVVAIGGEEMTATLTIDPGATAGLRDVIVTNPDTQSDTLEEGFEVTAAPAVEAGDSMPLMGVAF